jgi:DNA-directed RNA polymerase specialized sigma24 family protein
MISQDWMRTALVEHQRPMLYIALGVLKHSERAEETVADSTLTAFEQINNGKVRANSEGEFFSWLRTIVRRNAQRLAIQAASNGTGNADIQPTAGDRNYRRANPQSELEESDADFGCQEIDSERSWGRSKRCPNADDQLASF